MAYHKRFEDTYLDDNDEEFGDTGKTGIAQLIASAEAALKQGDKEKAGVLWARILDIAQATSNKDLYYRASDEIAALGEAQ